MATVDQIQPGKLFRHKGGKFYKVEGDYRSGDRSKPMWAKVTDERGMWKHDSPNDFTKVWCTQWQVNEKYPEGREYQAARILKLADLTPVD